MQTMQTVHKLKTNTTNRLAFTPCPTRQLPINNLSNLTSSSLTSKTFQSLLDHHFLLQQELVQAKQQHQMMLELFDSIAQIERGESKPNKKLLRRCRKDILEWHLCPHSGCNRQYSSQTSLQRHLKIKHTVVKVQPPQLYNDLQPPPNLTQEKCVNAVVQELEKT